MTQPTRRILLVDDESFVRSALRRALRREPYEIDEADHPDKALELLGRGGYDMVIADHLMPGMTGLELLQIARTRWPDTVRIILTGHADMQTAIDGINVGEIYRFLTKPWDDTELKVTLFHAFERLDLERENRRLLATVRHQAAVLERIEKNHPGIAAVRRDHSGAIVLDDEDVRKVLGVG